MKTLSMRSSRIRSSFWCAVLISAAAMPVGLPAAARAANSGGAVLGQQEANPFAPKPAQPRELPSILQRDGQGRVVWIEGDPARTALEVIDFRGEEEQLARRILAERDAELLRMAIVNADKILDALKADREQDYAQFDTVSLDLMQSMGVLGRRGPFHNDPDVRRGLSRPTYNDLSTILRQYNMARVEEGREQLEAYYADRQIEVTELMLRESTILQRYQQLDMLADATRMLRERLGGDEALASAHPQLADTIDSQGYWLALAELSDAELAAFVQQQTGVDVRFPSPVGEEALAPLRESDSAQSADNQDQAQVQGPPVQDEQGNQSTGNQSGNQSGDPSGNQGNTPRRGQSLVGQANIQPDAQGEFTYTDEDLEELRVEPQTQPTLLRRDADGRAVRLDGVSFVLAYEAMRDAGEVSEKEIEAFEELLNDRDKTFDEQALRLYEFLLAAAVLGPVEEGPLHDAVLNDEWKYAALFYGAWLNERLPAPSTVHNDMRVREALEWDNLVKMSRIANEYDGAHIFDARIELLKMVRDREDMNDASIALPGNIKRPWRLQQIIRDAKASYATQLRVTEPDFRQVLAQAGDEVQLEEEVAEELAKLLDEVAKADGPMTEADFWAVAVKLPPEAHRWLIKQRTGYEAPEPGYFEDKVPTPSTGAPVDQ